MAFSIRLPKTLDARLERLHTSTGRPKSFFVRQALEMGRSLDVLEQCYLSGNAADVVVADHTEHELTEGYHLTGSQLELV